MTSQGLFLPEISCESNEIQLILRVCSELGMQCLTARVILKAANKICLKRELLYSAKQSVDLSAISFNRDSNYKYLVLAKTNEAIPLW